MLEEIDVCYEKTFYESFYKNVNEGYDHLYKGYDHLYKGLKEIVWEQLIVDPIQDTLIDYGFEQFFSGAAKRCDSEMCLVKHSVSKVQEPSKVNLLNFNNHLLDHLLDHVRIKFCATIVFPWIYSVSKIECLEDIKLPDFIEESIKFYSISPLEFLQSIKTILNPALKTNNTNVMDKVLYRDGYHKDRALDSSYYEFMHAYHSWMEAVDAVIHANNEIKAISKSLNGPASYLKVLEYLIYREKLYLNTKAEEDENLKKIGEIRSKLIDSPSVNDSDSNTEDKAGKPLDWGVMLAKNLPGAAFNLVLVYRMYKTANWLYSLYKAKPVVDDQRLILCTPCGAPGKIVKKIKRN